MKIVCGLMLFLFSATVHAQQPDKIYKPNIETVQLFQYGNQQGLPILNLNGTDRIQLEFDDMEGSLKNYYYTYVLCDYNWNPLNLNPFDYIKGFTQNRIGTYRYSSIAFTRYTHYQVVLPERNSAPSRSGNYLLKVFLDGDTSKLVFTKRMYVLDQKASIAGDVVQPFTPQLFSTHQRIKFTAGIKGINSFSAGQQVKAVILQNNRLDNAQKDILPTFVRGNSLEYNSETVGMFEGGKEWRWLDLRSFRLQSDRVERANYKKDSTDIFLKPDVDRRAQRYVYFADLDGMYQITTYESINPFWQGDYAMVYFSFAPPNGQPYTGQNIYLSGAFTNYDLNDKWKMTFNDETKLYEAKAFMKQGYYNYQYILADANDASKRVALEGNYWETENNYTILIYYKSFTDRADQLIGIGQFNSRRDRSGFSF
ncbi:MAG: DUF5103 domain-containing protein [Sphingobacteriales bacterium]|nr:MAG: DUF5103 domain-containing protein [Sphingobacteriales bacterium]